MMNANNSIDAAKPIHTDGGSSSDSHSAAFSPRPTKARLTQAAAIRPMKRRSPRVVRRGRKPLRSTVGDFSSYTVMPMSIRTTQEKNTATGVVHTIQLNIWQSSLRRYTRPIAKPFAM